MFFSGSAASMSGKENAAYKGNMGVLDEDVKRRTPGKKEWKMVGGLATPEEGVRKVKRVVAQPLRPSARANISTATFPVGDFLPRTKTVVFPDVEEPETKDEGLEDVLVQLQGLTIQTSSGTEGTSKPPLQEIAVDSSVQTRITAVFATVDVSVQAKQPAMRRMRTPTLLETDRASRDIRIQHEVEALRGLQRVDRAGKILVNMAVSGGGTVKALSDDPLSLQSMHILTRYMSERGD